MDKLTSIVIADNTEEFCCALTGALQRAGGFQVLGCANDGEQAIRMVMERKPENFDLALKSTLELLKGKAEQDQILFINAWNEWTEGSYLEPDTDNGYVFLLKFFIIV